MKPSRAFETDHYYMRICLYMYRGVTKVLTAAYGNYLQHVTHFIHNLLKRPLNIMKLGMDMYIVEENSI